MKYSRYKKEMEYSYALGATVVIELMRTAAELVISVVLHSASSPELKALILQLANEHGIAVEYGDKIFNVLSQKENCYVIGVFKKRQGTLQAADHVVLVNPSNSGNLGTIVRSAAGFHVQNIAVIEPAADIYDPKTIRASMGAVFHTNIATFPSFTDYLQQYPGRTCYPFMLKGAKTLQSLTAKEMASRYSLVFGNEATGLPDDYLSVGVPVFINQSDTIDSFNLQTAVSIALYAFTKESMR